MDVNGDGLIDILSGSYSRHSQEMAGLFQVLYGVAGGGFLKAQVLNGSDGEPLILPGDQQDHVTDRICTRPFLCDLDDDGKPDIVAGNFSGTFGLFKGEGSGKFAPKASWLKAGGNEMRVDAHSDPFLIDWDGDGDLDLLSGSAAGGAYLFVNNGSKTAPQFAKPVTLLKAAGHGGMHAGGEVQFGDAHVTAPASGTRVWADDVDGDGKLDLLIGDQLTLQHVKAGVTEQAAREQLAAWEKRQQELFQSMENDNAKDDFQKNYEQLQAEKKQFVIDETTGFVWLLRQK